MSLLTGRNYPVITDELGLIRPVCQQLDQQIAELAEAFARSDSRARNAIRKDLTGDELITLNLFSSRAAVFALRDRDVAWVGRGLSAIAMTESERADFRDVFSSLSLLEYAAKHLGSNAERAIEIASQLADPPTAKLIRGFTARLHSDKSIRSMGHEAITSQSGPGFANWWGTSKYEPTLDLLSIAMELADLFALDKYQPSSIHLAGDLPRCWLPGATQALLRWTNFWESPVSMQISGHQQSTLLQPVFRRLLGGNEQRNNCRNIT